VLERRANNEEAGKSEHANKKEKEEKGRKGGGWERKGGEGEMDIYIYLAALPSVCQS
jgi:hypothetical protein